MTLKGSSPPIWRRVLVAETTRLSALHEVIQAAMGWCDDHLHCFIVGREMFAPPEAGMGGLSERSHTLGQLAPRVGGKLHYTYDMGDSWEHTIAVEKVYEGGEGSPAVPSCVAGARACPPEDCGGVWGYAELLDCLADPEHPNYEDMLEWAGPIDSQAFDVKEADKRVSRLRKAPRKKKS